MKKNALIVLALTFVFSAMSCNTMQKELKQMSAEKMDSIHTISLDDTVVIELETNPTTGFKWVLFARSNNEVVKLQNREYIKDADNQNMIGAGGIDKWTFKATRKGEVTLQFDYKRENGEPEKTIYKRILVQ